MDKISSDQAYQYLREKIVSGEFPPGKALATETISAEVGVSRTPVRDALRRLEADGLVTIKARLGASVKVMDPEEFREMSGLRLALESFAAGLAAENRTPSDLTDLGAALDSLREQSERAIASGRYETFDPIIIREDIRFHLAVLTAAKNNVIKKEILRLHLINRVMFGVPDNAAPKDALGAADEAALRRAVVEDHARIFEAITTRNAAAAKVSMENHLTDMIENNIRSMARRSGAASRKLTGDETSYSVTS